MVRFSPSHIGLPVELMVHGIVNSVLALLLAIARTVADSLGRCIGHSLVDIWRAPSSLTRK